jgi:ribosome-associated protein
MSLESNNKTPIPEDEIHFIFAHSSGAGGQNVNKTATKAILHWWVGGSKVLSFEEKERVREKLKNKLNMDDEVVITSEEERSQLQNRERATQKLQDLVQEALKVPKKRKPTRPTYTSKIKRIEHKKKRSIIKQSRKNLEE